MFQADMKASKKVMVPAAGKGVTWPFVVSSGAAERLISPAETAAFLLLTCGYRACRCY